mgnify:CR=1 FL=1
MRKNYERVKTLQAELINDIKNWFIGKTDVLQVEFKRLITIQVDVDNTLDDEYSVEYVVINQLTNDGFVIDNDGEEIGLENLNVTELAFILDELELNNINLTIESE